MRFLAVGRGYTREHDANTKSDGQDDTHGQAREIRLGQIMESITHARALTMGTERGGGGGGGGSVGGHGASK